MRFYFIEMNPCAFIAIILLFILAEKSNCDDKTDWYLGLRTAFKNCPSVPWKNNSQEELFDSVRHCIQQQVFNFLDSFLVDDVISVTDGIDLVRLQGNTYNLTQNEIDRNETYNEIKDVSSWTTVILKRLARVLRTHVVKIDVDRLINNIPIVVNNSTTDTSNYIVEGRRRRHRRRHHMMPLMLMGLLLMGSILIPMGFQFLAVLGGKALILAKMALLLSSIQGLKKIATNGVNYGLYHAPVAEGWHERSHQDSPTYFHLPYPVQSESHS